ncbi:MAG: histidine phosphatase family protein, partial [Dehalococcoidales bacterium]|nr:histidine phosphatase family protein [Dehalococcoidales bacterium]
TFQEISQLYPELARTWLTRSLAFKFPGGESIADLDNRVSKFLDRLEKHIAEETVLIVAHSGVLRLLICHLLRIEAWHWRQIRTDLASMSILETYPQATILTRLNDISHLD